MTYWIYKILILTIFKYLKYNEKSGEDVLKFSESFEISHFFFFFLKRRSTEMKYLWWLLIENIRVKNFRYLDKRRRWKKKKNLPKKGGREKKKGKLFYKNTCMFVGGREHKYDHHRVIRCPPEYKGGYYNDADPQRFSFCSIH